MRDEDIRLTIFNNRKRRISKEGYSLGTNVPEERIQPHTDVLKTLKETSLICEVKRSSPSKGIINGTLDPVKQAGIYHDAGVRVVSVLTEEDYFSGLLDDLIRIKAAYPDLAVLRKDFLFCREDIDVSHCAGADLILLIASLLSEEEISDLYAYAVSKGITPLVEVHSSEDIGKVRSLAPVLTGINCRDLRTFTIDRLFPVGQKQQIDWDPLLVYESGIWGKEDAYLAGNQGFEALLIGESVVRDPKRIPAIREGLREGQENMGGEQRFWERISKLKDRERPIVKICGITNDEDAKQAVSLGADILGFIFAESPRETDAAFVRTLSDLDVLKVAVVVNAHADDDRYRQVKELLDEGLIDAVQYHGSETAEDCFDLGYPYYKAFRIKSSDDIQHMKEYHCPRVLIDAYHPVLHGGTGKQIDRALVEETAKDFRLWIAGGINPDNVGDLLSDYRPELIDISSGVEAYPGKKDEQKLQLLFRNIEEAYE